MGPPRRHNPQSLHRRDQGNQKPPDVNQKIRAMEQRAQEVMTNVQNTVLKAEDRVDNLNRLELETEELEAQAAHFEKSAKKNQMQQLGLLIKERMLMIMLIAIPVLIII